MTLFCLPFAGAGASIYRPWVRASDRPGVVAVQLPGREERYREPPPRTIHEAAASAAAAVDRALGAAGRCALFGHSFGALVAYECAHVLRERFGRDVALVVASGAAAPGVARTAQLSRLDDDAFVAQLSARSGFAFALPQEPVLRGVALRALRGDVACVETYVRPAHPALACPVLALRGAADAFVSSDAARAWRDETSAAFGYREFPGAHLFVRDAMGDVLAAVRDELQAAAR